MLLQWFNITSIISHQRRRKLLKPIKSDWSITLAWIAARSLSMPLNLLCRVIIPVRSLPSSSVACNNLVFSSIHVYKKYQEYKIHYLMRISQTHEIYVLTLIPVYILTFITQLTFHLFMYMNPIQFFFLKN